MTVERVCVDCAAPTTGMMRLRRNGWRGLLDRLRKRYVPLCVGCARRVIVAARPTKIHNR